MDLNPEEFFLRVELMKAVACEDYEYASELVEFGGLMGWLDLEGVWTVWLTTTT